MIISRAHRYVFVQVPQTGSTAVAAELEERYGGEPVLHKHSHLHELRRELGAELDSYAVGAGIRHPMDQLVSQYFKKKTDHKNRFSNPRNVRAGTRRVAAKRLEQFRFIRDEEADFTAYFERYFGSRPFTTGWRREQRGADVLIRFESIQEGFSELLQRIGLEQQRPLPLLNPTAGRSRSYADFYPPTVRDRAIAVFGPFLEDWRYDWPPDWDVGTVSSTARAHYLLVEHVKATRNSVRSARQGVRTPRRPARRR